MKSRVTRRKWDFENSSPSALLFRINFVFYSFFKHWFPLFTQIMSSHKRGRVEWWSDENTLEEEFSSMSLLPPSKRKILYTGRDDFQEDVSMEPKPTQTLHDLAGVDGVSNMVMQFLNPKDLAATSRVSKKMGALVSEKASVTPVHELYDIKNFDYKKFGHVVKHIYIDNYEQLPYLSKEAVKYLTNCETVTLDTRKWVQNNKQLYFPHSVQEITMSFQHLCPSIYKINSETHPNLKKFTFTARRAELTKLPDAITHLIIEQEIEEYRTVRINFATIKWPASIISLELPRLEQSIRGVVWPETITEISFATNQVRPIGDQNETYLPPRLQRLEFRDRGEYSSTVDPPAPIYKGTLPPTLTHLINIHSVVNDNRKFPSGLQHLEFDNFRDDEFESEVVDVWTLPPTLTHLINVHGLEHTVDGMRPRPDDKIMLCDLPNLTHLTFGRNFHEVLRDRVVFQRAGVSKIRRIEFTGEQIHGRDEHPGDIGKSLAFLTSLKVLHCRDQYVNCEWLPTSLVDLVVYGHEQDFSLKGIQRLTNLVRLVVYTNKANWKSNGCDWPQRNNWHNVFPESLRFLGVTSNSNVYFKESTFSCPIRCNFKFNGIICLKNYAHANADKYLDLSDWDMSHDIGNLRALSIPPTQAFLQNNEPPTLCTLTWPEGIEPLYR
jgi:hypothetical protein